MTCKDCIHYEVCKTHERLFGIIADLCGLFKNKAGFVEVKSSRIKWINRPISAQYVEITKESGEKHYGKVHDRIENNPVGYCGECGRRLDDTFMKFCPNCGARMDGDE